MHISVKNESPSEGGWGNDLSENELRKGREERERGWSQVYVAEKDKSAKLEMGREGESGCDIGPL